MRWSIWHKPKQSCVGLAINHTRIQLVYLIPEAKRVSICKTAQVDISVQPTETLSDATLRVIKQLVHDSKIPYRDVISALSDTDCLSTQTSLSQNSSDWKINALVAAAPYIPVPLDILHFDFQLCKAVDDRQKVLGVFCRKQIITDRLNLLKESGLRLVALEPNSHALERSFRYLYDTEKYPLCWACVALNHSDLTILLWSHNTVLGSFSDNLDTPHSLLGTTTQLQQHLMRLLSSYTVNPLQGLWIVGDHALCMSVQEETRKILHLNHHPPIQWRQTGVRLFKQNWSAFHIAFGLALRSYFE